MCNFFSFLTDGSKKMYFFSGEQRRKGLRFRDGQTIDNYDSHASIARYYGLREDDWSKGEYNPFTDKIEIDQQATTWDESAVRGMLAGVNWYDLCGDLEGARAFLQELREIRWLQPDGKLQDGETIRLFDNEDAAWYAARDAARDAALYTCTIHVCVGLPIERKHIDHVTRRMDVWRHGYGVARDVDGVLYCYERR